MIRLFHKPVLSVLIALMLWASGVTPAWARSEYEVKAAYLYNFIKFVTWPEHAADDQPIELCVYGEDPFQVLLKPIADLKAQGRPLKLRYPSERMDIAGCDVLYISASESRSVEDLLARAHADKTLTVSDMKDFTRQGGMIGFVTIGNVIRFQINLAAARASDLRISSKLLELAQDVIQ